MTTDACLSPEVKCEKTKINCKERSTGRDHILYKYDTGRTSCTAYTWFSSLRVKGNQYKMERLFCLVVALATCAAHIDLSGKAFIFPKETDTDHIKLLTPKTEFTALTICMRFISDQTRTYSLFSLATPTNFNAMLIYKTRFDVLRIFALDHSVEFTSLPMPENTWHSLCVTWESGDGLAQLWIDGKPSVKKFLISGTPIRGHPITILGQEQDAHGGGFVASQSFVGMISDLHVWDNVLSPIEVQRYMKSKQFTPGDVFNWGSLDYATTGEVFVDDDPEDQPW
ncbi:C-reactive protein-like [Cynoglossus semilaevis]|nr:C-reactive protein-like [Cynoglossus semilaevis]